MHTPIFRWKTLAAAVGLVSALGACTGGGAAEDGDDAVATAGDSDTANDGDSLAPDWNGGLTVQVMNETTAVLSWEAASDDTTATDALTYRVWWAAASGAQPLDGAPQAVTEPGATSLTISGLRPSKEHFFVVRAVDEEGLESMDSEEASGLQPDTTAPEFDGIESATPAGGGRIAVAWNEAVDNGAYAEELRYAVSVSTTSGAHDWSVPTAVTEPGATSLEIDGLEELVEYYVSVRAIDTNDNTDNNVVEREVTTPDETAPAFAGATLAVGAGSSIQVQWDPATDNVSASNELQYRLYVADMSGEHDFAVPTLTTPAGATSAAVTGLPLSTAFFVVVRAIDEAGNEDDNEVEVTAFTGATSDETPPVYDGVLIAEAQSATEIRLAWDLATDDQTPQGSIVYDVYQSLVLGDYNFNTPVQTSSPGEAFTFVNGLDPETEYFFVVRARDISGNQDSNLVQASAETMPDTTPPVFAGVQQVQGTSATTVGLNWDAGSDDTTPAGQLVYQVFMGPPGAVDWTTPIATTPPGQTNFVVTNLFPEQPFSFGVRALDAYLNADDNTQSLQGSALQDTTPPTFAGVESIGDISWNDGTVFWNAATDDVSSAADIYYEVYAAESGETIPYASPVATTQPGETKFALTGLRPGYDYDVAVRAFDQFGNGEANTSFKTFTTASDVTPPTFGGPTGFAAVAATSLTPEWNLATDNAWGAADISYQVCRSNLAAACGFGAGTWTTHASGTNVTSLALTGLTASTTYYVWVRATDGTGNVASPSNSVSATTSNDVTPPTFAGATGTSAVAGCAGAASFTVSWTAGTDNSTPQASLVYDLWYSSVSGAAAISRANSLAPDATSAAGTTQYTLTGLSASTTYYVVVRARDFAGLNDANSVTVSRATAADVCAPTGGNASSASMSDCNTLSVSYGAASDNVTAASAHTYQACVSASSTGCSTTWTTAKSQVGGSSMTVDVANPGTWYVWVRPVDGAGLAGGIGTNRSVALTDSGSPTMAAGSLVLTASNAVAGRVSMSWPQGSDACWSSASIEYQVCNGDLASCSGAGWVTHRSPGTAESTTYDTGLYDEYMVLYVRARDPSGNVSTAKSAGVTTSVHYDTQILGDIWNAKCAGGCHTWTRATTVGQAALCTSGSIITTGTPTNSIMYRLMSETSPPCTRMPYGGPYDSLDWQRLLRWIQQGALDN